MENNWLNLVNLLKRILISTEIAQHLKNKKVFIELVEERSSELKNLAKRVNPDNLIYIYKTEVNVQNILEIIKFDRVN